MHTACVLCFATVKTVNRYFHQKLGLQKIKTSVKLREYKTVLQKFKTAVLNVEVKNCIALINRLNKKLAHLRSQINYIPNFDALTYYQHALVKFE